MPVLLPNFHKPAFLAFKLVISSTRARIRHVLTSDTEHSAICFFGEFPASSPHLTHNNLLTRWGIYLSNNRRLHVYVLCSNAGAIASVKYTNSDAKSYSKLSRSCCCKLCLCCPSIPMLLFRKYSFPHLLCSANFTGGNCLFYVVVRCWAPAVSAARRLDVSQSQFLFIHLPAYQPACLLPAVYLSLV